MKVVDLRNSYVACSDELIGIGKTYIYYAEEKMEEGHPSLFLLEYNRETKRERVLANYLLPGPACVQHYFDFPEEIVMVSESGGSEAWILRVDKRTGSELCMASLNFIGAFLDCAALDETHLLFFTGTSEKHAQLFQEYKKLTGFSRVAYLYDLEEGRYCYARDPRICRGNASLFIPYLRGGEPRLLVLQPHGSEAYKRECCRNQRWLGDNIDDNVWDIPLHDFIVSVKNGEARVPLELVFSAGTAGMVRFAGEDSCNLYFRAEHFPSGDQRICAFSKKTGHRFVAARLSPGHTESPERFSIDRRGGCAYRITERSDEYEVRGVMNSSLDTAYPKDLGEFVTCVDGRFLVTRYILADETDSFEFSSVFDAETATQKSYEGRAAVCGSTIVLY
jgi:hypothetical protein